MGKQGAEGDSGMDSSDLGRFEKFERIGSGGFGEVFRGWDHVRGHEVALKTMNLDDVADDIEAIQKEVAVLSACRCDNIVRYYASVLPPGSMEITIAMELLPASAVDLMAVEGGPLDEDTIAWILRGAISALVYLHNQSRMHRDLKAANVLLACDGAVKLSDFGVAGALTGTLGFQRATFVGTPYWMAPEVIEAAEQGSYGSPADIWSAGITAIELAKGAPPLAELHPMRALFFIPKSSPPRLTAHEGHSPSLVSFVEACLQVDPRLRPSALELLQHPFVETAALPATLPALVADAAHMCSRAAHRAAAEKDSEESMRLQHEGGPEWEYGTTTSLPPALPGGGSSAADAASNIADPLASCAVESSYTGSFRVYHNAAAADSLDGGVLDMTGEPNGAPTSVTSAAQQHSLPRRQSGRSEASALQGSHPIRVQAAPKTASFDDVLGTPPGTGSSRPDGRASPSAHKPLSGWVTRRERSTPTRKKSDSQLPLQNPAPPPSLADDAVEVLQSLSQQTDPALAPFAQAASQLFGDKGNESEADAWSDLGPLGKALLAQMHRDLEQRAKAAS